MSILNVEPNQLSWNVVRTLGEGAYGEVKLVVDSNNPNCAVAIKCIDLVKHPEVAETARKEALLMRRLRGHVNIIQYIGMRVDENTEEFQIFLEYADGGELFDQIEPDIGMSTQKAQFYFRQIIDGLEYIHSNGIAHRDIKPENLLLTKQDVLKISDFGMATMFRHNGRERMLETKCGTLPYCSPEILKTRYRAEPSDIWSCGIVLVALLAGELAWDSPTQECDSFRRWNESTNLDHAPWNKISTVALCNNPSRRATIARIRQHPWFIKDFSKERSCMLPVNSNSSTGDYHSMECPIKRRKRSLNTLFERDYDPESMSQPTIGTITENSSELPCNNQTIAASNCQIESFSQPENIEMLLLNYSQVDHNQQTLQCADPLQRLVRRMTRFCVTKKISATEAMVHIGSACETCGYSIRFGPANKMTVHHTKDRREMSFVVTIYEMVDNNGRKVLVDFRRSKGDGIEFKRTFVHLKKKLMSIVCGESTAWLTLQGLVCNQELNQLSLDAESS